MSIGLSAIAFAVLSLGTSGGARGWCIGVAIAAGIAAFIRGTLGE